MPRPLPMLLPLLLLAACAHGKDPAGCAPAAARLENLSGQAVEQLYLGPAGASRGAPWGADLVTGDALLSGAGLPLQFEGRGPYALRVVWVNGQAAELRGIDGCTTLRVIIRDSGLRAE
jgi:hypothetical protein